MAGTGAREVCDGEAAGPGAQGAGSVIVFPEGFKKRSDRVGFHVLKHRSWLLDGERCRSSDLFGGVCSKQPEREVEAVAAGAAEAERIARTVCFGSGACRTRRCIRRRVYGGERNPG